METRPRWRRNSHCTPFLWKIGNGDRRKDIWKLDWETFSVLSLLFEGTHSDPRPPSNQTEFGGLPTSSTPNRTHRGRTGEEKRRKSKGQGRKRGGRREVVDWNYGGMRWTGHKGKSWHDNNKPTTTRWKQTGTVGSMGTLFLLYFKITSTFKAPWRSSAESTERTGAGFTWTTPGKDPESGKWKTEMV